MIAINIIDYYINLYVMEDLDSDEEEYKIIHDLRRLTVLKDKNIGVSTVTLSTYMPADFSINIPLLKKYYKHFNKSFKFEGGNYNDGNKLKKGQFYRQLTISYTGKNANDVSVNVNIKIFERMLQITGYCDHRLFKEYITLLFAKLRDIDFHHRQIMKTRENANNVPSYILSDPDVICNLGGIQEYAISMINTTLRQNLNIQIDKSKLYDILEEQGINVTYSPETECTNIYVKFEYPTKHRTYATSANITSSASISVSGKRVSQIINTYCRLLNIIDINYSSLVLPEQVFINNLCSELRKREWL